MEGQTATSLIRVTGGAMCRPRHRERVSMVRVFVYVTLLGALFVGAVLSAGNAIGAWEPAVAPLSTTVEKSKRHEHHGTHHTRRPAKPKHG
jgi:hypothetical protein